MQNEMFLSRILTPLALATTLLAQPAIKPGGIVNVSGYQATLAPGTVFVIFGSNMGPASIATATAPNYPAILGGTSVTFTPSAGERRHRSWTGSCASLPAFDGRLRMP